jgi:thiamine biosynthesis lipoprotein
MAAPLVPGILLEVGGDVVVHGHGPAGGPWAIGIEDPLDPAELLATVDVTGGAVATSSTAVRSWTIAGRPVHHLIDPFRGAPAESGLTSVSVAMSDPAWAEVWSKALFLAGRAQIGPEAKKRGLAAWWVEGDGGLHMSPAARPITTWVRGEATAF